MKSLSRPDTQQARVICCHSVSHAVLRGKAGLALFSPCWVLYTQRVRNFIRKDISIKGYFIVLKSYPPSISLGRAGTLSQQPLSSCRLAQRRCAKAKGWPRKLQEGLPWWSTGLDSVLSMQGTQVQPLAGELRSHMSLPSLERKIRSQTHA